MEVVEKKWGSVEGNEEDERARTAVLGIEREGGEGVGDTIGRRKRRDLWVRESDFAMAEQCCDAGGSFKIQAKPAKGFSSW